MSKLMERILIFFGVSTILMLEAWEFCNKPEIGEKVCRAGKSHFMCGEIQAQAGRWVTVEVKAPPMTRKIKRYFLEFFNSLRNNISSGTYTLSNGQTFPIAARMREVIWDNELEFMMQTWVRAGKESKLDCIGSQRLNFVYTKLFTSPQKYKLPFFKIVDLTLLAYTKNMDGISNTKEVQSYGTA
ncbi:uncharacterized protein LOC119644536 [Glossina fuscipes]|uniref:Uncharacterized protein LOC119644535 n=1 Tax=Glossina fuscipes TaxID=7396 RepID=A0A9C5ZMY5_9MUSC|nr:uncharacterized protein LOC119644535 [Glossina fuscipes]XP_037900026.1 uncharacterized protein LOC119644536 [Glossina fuscipes]